MIVKLLEPVEYLGGRYQAGDVIRVTDASGVDMIHDHIAVPVQHPAPKQVIEPAETREGQPDDG